jgi:hypothetical protein
MRIIGYAFEADVHCPACTLKRWQDCADAIRAVAIPEVWHQNMDENGVPLRIHDREGNEVHPIFSTDEGALQETCGDCHANLYDPDAAKPFVLIPQRQGANNVT